LVYTVETGGSDSSVSINWGIKERVLMWVSERNSAEVT
jgi:hypothetical protein